MFSGKHTGYTGYEEISTFLLVSVAEQTGLSLTWLKTLRTWFLAAHLINEPNATKSVFGVFDKVTLKPVSLATETS